MMMMMMIILVYCLLWHFNSILQLLSAMLSIYLFHHLAILATTLINACLLVQWHVPLPKCCKKLLPHAKVSLKSGNRLLSYDRKRFSIWPPSAIINFKKLKIFVFGHVTVLYLRVRLSVGAAWIAGQDRSMWRTLYDPQLVKRSSEWVSEWLSSRSKPAVSSTRFLSKSDDFSLTPGDLTM